MKISNPELQRNLWLEITLERIIAGPIVLGLLLAAMTYGETWPARALRGDSIYGFVLVTVIWGARLAGQSLTAEFTDGTWDSQRLGGLTASQLLLGKMFGGAAYAWYLGFWLLLVFLFNAIGRLPLALILMTVLGLLSLAVFAQALSMFTTLLSWRRGRNRQISRRPGLGTLAALAIGFCGLPVLPEFISGEINSKLVIWLGHPWSERDFIIVSLLAFAAWSYLGVHQALRAELQFRDGPVFWILFLGFALIYMAGWINAGVVELPVVRAPFLSPIGPAVLPLRLLAAATVALALAYVFVFLEPKDRLCQARLLADLRTRRFRAVFANSPLWLINLIASLGCIIAALIAMSTDGLERSGLMSVTAACFAVLLYAIRDISIVLACNLVPNPRRADSAAAIYLGVLHLLMPLLFSLSGFAMAQGFVRPLQAYFNPIWLVAAAAWALLALWLLRHRWTQTDNLR